MKGLIDAFSPELGEDPIGYFRRLAVRNGYKGWQELVRTSGINPSLNALWKSHSRVAHDFGLDQKWTESIFPREQEGHGLHDPFYRRQISDPFCPSCLKEAEHVRHGWSHCFVTACPVHQCQLIERCPNCDTSLNHSRQGIALCDCGYDLRYSEALPAPMAQCWVSARLAGDMRPFKGAKELGRAEDYVKLADLLFQLTVRHDVRATVRPAKVARPKTVLESIGFLAPVFQMLEDWETRFFAHVEDRFLAGDASSYSLAGRLGAWYTNLHKLCQQPPAFGLVWQVFSDAAFELFDGILRGQNGLSPSLGKKRGFLSLKEAAQVAGVSGPTLQRAIDEKLLHARLSRQGTSYQVTMVSRAEAEHFRDLRSEWITEGQAAERLGVTSSVLQHLVRARILGFDERWGLSVQKAGPIPAAELPLLVAKLSVLVQGQTTDDALTLNDLTARRTVDIKALTGLYQAIFSGQLRPVGYDVSRGLGGFSFSASKVKKFLGSVALSTALTLPQLERATGWKYEALRQWVNLGLLESDEVSLQGTTASIVTVSALARFRCEWVPISEIAHVIGSTSAAISKKLELKGIQITGQTTPATGGRRGGLIRFRDLVLIADLAPN